MLLLAHVPLPSVLLLPSGIEVAASAFNSKLAGRAKYTRVLQFYPQGQTRIIVERAGYTHVRATAQRFLSVGVPGVR